ncbi:MAG: sulfotransferase [Verrucomicrobiaceae bacterium]|nr:sulfotransferase [Verrucomicrobiaceae bacterium]
MSNDPWFLNPSLFHPMGACTWSRFRQLYRENGPYNRRSLVSRFCAMQSVLMRIPAVAIEEWRYGRAIREHVLHEPPVFIIGHWRSGTTHLHNLLSLDPRFAYMTSLQTALPHEFMGIPRLTRWIMAALTPKTRGMDNMEMGIDLPQEEEMALGILSGISAYQCFYFPRHHQRHSRQALLFEDLPAPRLKEFKDAYLHLVRKVSHARGGRCQILFKNPASTSRIPLLLELFPGARFIHIVRNPHEVYHSMQKLLRRMVPGFSWQDFGDMNFAEICLEPYELLMRRYLADRALVPAGHLVEVRYEDLDRSPVETVDGIYASLGLPGREEQKERVREYIRRLESYQKNQHPEDPQARAKVAERWRFAFEAFGYEP